MNNIQVTCDSTCDLTSEIYDQYNIEVLPLGVSMGDDFRYDRVNVTAQELYDYADATGDLPKTSAVSIGQYEDCFRKYVEKGMEVIHISLCSDISACYQNACIAAEALGHVTVIDSRNLSTGSGHLALLAVELAAADYRPGEIRAALEEIRQQVDVSFVLNTLEYLHKGGRCSGIAAFGANLLKLHPEIRVLDGAMHVGPKYRGDLEKSILTYVRSRLEGQTDLQPDRIFVTHSGVPAPIVEKVIALVKELQPFEAVIETIAGSTISSHCGPACLGLAYLHSKPCQK